VPGGANQSKNLIARKLRVIAGSRIIDESNFNMLLLELNERDPSKIRDENGRKPYPLQEGGTEASLAWSKMRRLKSNTEEILLVPALSNFGE
jgi:hypothetical protein